MVKIFELNSIYLIEALKFKANRHQDLRYWRIKFAQSDKTSVSIKIFRLLQVIYV